LVHQNFACLLLCENRRLDDNSPCHGQVPRFIHDQGLPGVQSEREQMDRPQIGLFEYSPNFLQSGYSLVAKHHRASADLRVASDA